MRTAALLLVALAATVLAGPPAMPTPLYAKTTLAFTYSSTTIKFVDNYYFSSLGARFEDVFSGVSTYVASSATTYVALASGPFYNQTKSGSNAATCISSASSGPTYVASLPYQISIISTSSCTSWTTTSGVTYGGVSATQYTSSTCSLSSSYSALITSILINTYYSGSKLLGGNGTAYVSLIGSVPFTLTVNTWDTNTPASSNFTAPSSCTEIVTESSSPVATAVSSSEAATVTTGNPPAMPTALHAKTTLSFTYTSYTITFVDNYYFSSSVGSRFDDTFSGVGSVVSAMSTELLALPSGPFYNVTTVGSGSPTCQSSASSGPSYISSLPYQVSVINTANCGTWTVTSGVSYGGSSATQYYSSSCSLTMSSYSSLISSIKIYLYYSGSTLLGGNGTATVSVIGTVPFTLAVNTWDASTPASSYFDVPSSCTAITSSEIAAVESSDPATVVTESSATAVVTESSDSTVLPPAQAEGSYMKVQLAITYAAYSISIAFNEETYVSSSAARSDSKFGGFSLLTYNFPAYNSSIIANTTTGITWSTMETASSSYCNTTSDGASEYKILRRHLSIINFYKCTWKMSTVTVSGTAVDRYTSSDCVVDMASLSSIIGSLSISLDYQSGGSKLLNGTGTAKISSFSIPVTITVKQYTSATQSSSLFTIPSLCGTSSTIPQLPVPLHMASKIAFSTSLVSATIYDDLYLTSSDMRWDFNFSGISGILSSVVMRVVASSSSDKIYNYTKSGTSAAACKTSSSGGSALVSASRYKLDTAYLNKCSWTVTSGVTYGSTSATQYHSDACNFYGVSATGLNLYYDGDELLGGSGSGTLTYNSQTYTADVTVTVTTWDTSSIASSTFASLQCSSTSAGTTAVVSSLLAFIAVFVSLL